MMNLVKNAIKEESNSPASSIVKDAMCIILFFVLTIIFVKSGVISGAVMSILAIGISIASITVSKSKYNDKYKIKDNGEVNHL